MTVEATQVEVQAEERVAAVAGRGITKTFGPVTALEDVTFSAHYGRVLAPAASLAAKASASC